MAQLSSRPVRRVHDREDVPPLPIDLEIVGLDVPRTDRQHQLVATQTAVVDRRHVEALMAAIPRIGGRG